jgi:tetratricopeptide (TPR) repeat protein
MFREATLDAKINFESPVFARDAQPTIPDNSHLIGEFTNEQSEFSKMISPINLSKAFLQVKSNSSSRFFSYATFSPMTTLVRERLVRTRREAEGYLELGMPEHALRSLQRQGKIVHGDARGCYLLGESLRELHRYREAIFPFRRSLELIPDDVHVWMAIGWCYKRVGDIAKAIDSLESALSIEPGEAVLHYNLACYWSIARDRRQALRCLTHALNIDGNFRDFIADEPDFDPLRNDPLFKNIVGVLE